MKVWITKYALSDGIIEAEDAEIGSAPSMIRVPSLKPRFMFPFFHGEGKDWHKTEEAALAKVADMKKRKIASLKKQIAKLEK